MIEEEKLVFEPDVPNVPTGWEVAPFLKVVSVASDAGKRLKQRDYLEKGKIPIIDQGQDFIGGYTDNDGLAFVGDLPVVLFGDHTRAIKFVDKRFAVGAEGIKILKPANCYDPKFFYYLLTSLQIPSRGYSRHFQFLKKFSLPIAPMAQQTRIVAEIEKQFSRLDEAVANLKRVKANLKRYKAAVLKAAVEGKLTEEWRKIHVGAGSEGVGAGFKPASTETGAELLQRILAERRKAVGKGKYKEPVGPDTSGLPELPSGWVWASVEQLSILVQYGSSAKTSEDETGVPVLRMGNIVDGVLNYEELKYLPASHDEFPRLFLQPGDLLFNRTNSPELVGKTAVYSSIKTAHSFASYLIRVRLSANYLSSLLSHYINSSYGRHWIKSVVTQQVGQANVNGTKLQALAVPVPPLLEQHQIVAEVERRLSIVAGAEAQVDANLRRADRLRQSILKQAFSGKLVPQDPNDKPVSALLERIRNNVGEQFIAPKSTPRQSRKTKIEQPERAQSIAPQQQTVRAGLKPAPTSSLTSLDSILTAILDRMQPGCEYSRADLADPLGLSTGQWNAAIQELKRVGKVRQVGEKRGARYELVKGKGQ